MRHLAPSTMAARRLSTYASPRNVLSIQSHVVFGAAGNSAAVFPMRRLGVNVWPLHTVQFSNHTQYGKWKGMVIPPEQLTEVAQGIEDIGELRSCDAVLSGYLGSEQQGGAVVEVVKRVKAANPAALYCCDPVMGHPAKGCIVAPGVAEYLTREVVSQADIVCPNTVELGILTGRGDKGLDSMESVMAAVEQLLASGPKVVFVKHLGLTKGDASRFEMLLAVKEAPGAATSAWQVSTPMLPFDRPPTGVGDLTTGLFLARRLQGHGLKAALEHTAAAYFEVMKATSQLGQYELQVVAAQDGIAAPTEKFEALQVL